MEESPEDFDFPTPKELVFQDVLKLVREFDGKALVTTLALPRWWATMAAGSSRWFCSSGSP